MKKNGKKVPLITCPSDLAHLHLRKLPQRTHISPGLSCAIQGFFLKVNIFFKSEHKLGKAAYGSNSSTQEAEVGGLKALGQPGLHGKTTSPLKKRRRM